MNGMTIGLEDRLKILARILEHFDAIERLLNELDEYEDEFIIQMLQSEFISTRPGRRHTARGILEWYVRELKSGNMF